MMAFCSIAQRLPLILLCDKRFQMESVLFLIITSASQERKYDFINIYSYEEMGVRVMRYDLRNVFNEGFYRVRFIECLSYRESTVKSTVNC